MDRDLKHMLINKSTLKIFDPARYTELHKDASSQELAAFLLQRVKYIFTIITDSQALIFVNANKTNNTQIVYNIARICL